MKILSVKNDKEYAIFEVELDDKEWAKALAATKKNIAKNMQIPGFRKGHVPQNIINERISDEQVSYDAINNRNLFNSTINAVMESKEFKDSDCIDSFAKSPEVVKFGKTPVVKYFFDLVPEVKGFALKDVADIEIPAVPAANVPEALVKNEVKRIIKRDAMISEKKNATVANGDIAVINFKGFMDGKPFAGGEGKNFELEIGSKSFIDNFEDQLIGCKKGDKKDVNVKFPKDYPSKNLAGKPAKFEVEVLNVKEIEYPEINKEYLKGKNIDAANEKELEQYIRNIYIEQSKLQHQDMAIKLINEEIAKKASIGFYPASLIQMHKNQILNQYEQEARQNGFKSLADYKKMLKLDNEQFEKVLNDSAKKCLVVALAYEKLIDELKLKVEEADEKDYLSKLTRYVGDAKRAKEMYEKNKDWAESNMIKDKLFKKLIEKAKKAQPKAEVKPDKKPAKKSK